MNPALEMRLWVQSDNPDYQEAVKERLAELRAKGEARRESRLRELAKKAEWEQFKRDLFNRLLSIIPRRGAGFVLRSESLKEEGHLSDLEVWNGYEWERG